MEIRIQSNILRAIQAACGKKDARQYLNGWKLDLSDPDNPLAVTTNGRILLTAPVTVSDHNGPIPKHDLIFAPLAIPKRKNPLPVVLNLDTDTGTGTCLCGPKELEIVTIEGTYPNWRSVVEKAKRGWNNSKPLDHIGFDPLLLSPIVEALGQGGETPFCRLEFGSSPTDHYRVKFSGPSYREGLEDLFCILMPCRV